MSGAEGFLCIVGALYQIDRTSESRGFQVSSKRLALIQVGRHKLTETKLVQDKFQPMKLFLTLSILLLASCVAMAEDKEKSSAGAGTFKSKCILCHGADGTGKTPLGKQLQAANLGSKDVQKRPDAELQKIVHDGQANMPPFADQLSDEEISQVIRYVRQFGKAAKK